MTVDIVTRQLHALDALARAHKDARQRIAVAWSMPLDVDLPSPAALDGPRVTGGTPSDPTGDAIHRTNARRLGRLVQLCELTASMTETATALGVTGHSGTPYVARIADPLRRDELADDPEPDAADVDLVLAIHRWAFAGVATATHRMILDDKWLDTELSGNRVRALTGHVDALNAHATTVHAEWVQRPGREALPTCDDRYGRGCNRQFTPRYATCRTCRACEKWALKARKAALGIPV